MCVLTGTGSRGRQFYEDQTNLVLINDEFTAGTLKLDVLWLREALLKATDTVIYKSNIILNGQSSHPQNTLIIR